VKGNLYTIIADFTGNTRIRFTTEADFMFTWN